MAYNISIESDPTTLRNVSYIKPPSKLSDNRTSALYHPHSTQIQSLAVESKSSEELLPVIRPSRKGTRLNDAAEFYAPPPKAREKILCESLLKRNTCALGLPVRKLNSEEVEVLEISSSNTIDPSQRNTSCNHSNPQRSSRNTSPRTYAAKNCNRRPGAPHVCDCRETKAKDSPKGTKHKNMPPSDGSKQNSKSSVPQIVDLISDQNILNSSEIGNEPSGRSNRSRNAEIYFTELTPDGHVLKRSFDDRYHSLIRPEFVYSVPSVYDESEIFPLALESNNDNPEVTYRESKVRFDKSNFRRSNETVTDVPSNGTIRITDRGDESNVRPINEIDNNVPTIKITYREQKLFISRPTTGGKSETLIYPIDEIQDNSLESRQGSSIVEITFKKGLRKNIDQNIKVTPRLPGQIESQEKYNVNVNQAELSWKENSKPSPREQKPLDDFALSDKTEELINVAVFTPDEFVESTMIKKVEFETVRSSEQVIPQRKETVIQKAERMNLVGPSTAQESVVHSEDLDRQLRQSERQSEFGSSTEINSTQQSNNSRVLRFSQMPVQTFVYSSVSTVPGEQPNRASSGPSRLCPCAGIVQESNNSTLCPCAGIVQESNNSTVLRISQLPVQSFVHSTSESTAPGEQSNREPRASSGMNTSACMARGSKYSGQSRTSERSTQQQSMVYSFSASQERSQMLPDNPPERHVRTSTRQRCTVCKCGPKYEGHTIPRERWPSRVNQKSNLEYSIVSEAQTEICRNAPNSLYEETQYARPSSVWPNNRGNNPSVHFSVNEESVPHSTIGDSKQYVPTPKLLPPNYKTPLQENSPPIEAREQLFDNSNKHKSSNLNSFQLKDQQESQIFHLPNIEGENLSQNQKINPENQPFSQPKSHDIQMRLSDLAAVEVVPPQNMHRTTRYSRNDAPQSPLVYTTLKSKKVSSLNRPEAYSIQRNVLCPCAELETRKPSRMVNSAAFVEDWVQSPTPTYNTNVIHDNTQQVSTNQQLQASTVYLIDRENSTLPKQSVSYVYSASTLPGNSSSGAASPSYQYDQEHPLSLIYTTQTSSSPEFPSKATNRERSAVSPSVYSSATLGKTYSKSLKADQALSEYQEKRKQNQSVANSTIGSSRVASPSYQYDQERTLSHAYTKKRSTYPELPSKTTYHERSTVSPSIYSSATLGKTYSKSLKADQAFNEYQQNDSVANSTIGSSRVASPSYQYDQECALSQAYTKKRSTYPELPSKTTDHERSTVSPSIYSSATLGKKSLEAEEALSEYQQNRKQNQSIANSRIGSSHVASPSYLYDPECAPSQMYTKQRSTSPGFSSKTTYHERSTVNPSIYSSATLGKKSLEAEQALSEYQQNRNQNQSIANSRLGSSRVASPSYLYDPERAPSQMYTKNRSTSPGFSSKTTVRERSTISPSIYSSTTLGKKSLEAEQALSEYQENRKQNESVAYSTIEKKKNPALPSKCHCSNKGTGDIINASNEKPLSPAQFTESIDQNASIVSSKQPNIPSHNPPCKCQSGKNHPHCHCDSQKSKNQSIVHTPLVNNEEATWPPRQSRYKSIMKTPSMRNEELINSSQHPSCQCQGQKIRNETTLYSAIMSRRGPTITPEYQDIQKENVSIVVSSVMNNEEPIMLPQYLSYTSIEKNENSVLSQYQNLKTENGSVSQTSVGRNEEPILQSLYPPYKCEDRKTQNQNFEYPSMTLTDCSTRLIKKDKKSSVFSSVSVSVSDTKSTLPSQYALCKCQEHKSVINASENAVLSQTQSKKKKKSILNNKTTESINVSSLRRK